MLSVLTSDYPAVDALQKAARRRGLRYEIMPLTYGRGRIILTDGAFVDDGW